MTERDLQAQVARLKTLPRGEDQPWGKAGEPGLREELLRKLWTQAESAEHAKAIIDRVLDSVTFCPTPLELSDIAEQVPRPGQRKPKPRCGSCHGTGFRIVQRGRLSGAEPCQCMTQAVKGA